MNGNTNIEGLKKLSNVLIDFQYIQKLGMEIFNHEGAVTDKIIDSCTKFEQTCSTIGDGLNELKSVTSNYKQPTIR